MKFPVIKDKENGHLCLWGMEPSTTQMPFMPHWITDSRIWDMKNVIVGTVEGLSMKLTGHETAWKMRGKKKW